MANWVEESDGHFESFVLLFSPPIKHLKWTVIKAIVFVWLPLCPDDKPIIGGILQVKRRRWLRSAVYDWVDDDDRRGVPFDVESKSFDMAKASFRHHQTGRIANLPQVSDVVYDRLVEVMQAM